MTFLSPSILYHLHFKLKLRLDAEIATKTAAKPLTNRKPALVGIAVIGFKV